LIHFYKRKKNKNEKDCIIKKAGENR